MFGGVGSQLTLTWSSPQTIRRIVLYDRHPYDQVTSASVLLSNGTSAAAGTLDNDGGPYEIVFSSPPTVTSVQITITGVSGSTSNVGLAEVEVFGNAGP